MAGFDDSPERAATDFALADVYARTICLTDAGADAFVEYCRVEARALLEQNWETVCAVAKGLMVCDLLTGEQIDKIISTVDARVAREAEAERRQAETERAERAAVAKAVFEIMPRVMLNR